MEAGTLVLSLHQEYVEQLLLLLYHKPLGKNQPPIHLGASHIHWVIYEVEILVPAQLEVAPVLPLLGAMSKVENSGAKAVSMAACSLEVGGSGPDAVA